MCPVCAEYGIEDEDLERMEEVAGSSTQLCPICEEYPIPLKFHAWGERHGIEILNYKEYDDDER